MTENNKNIKTIFLLIATIIFLFIVLFAVEILKIFIFIMANENYNKDMLLARGFFYDVTGNKKQATEDYTYIINHTVHKFRKAVAYQARGDIELKAGQYNKAIEDYNIALVISPDYAYTYKVRARAKASVNDVKGAKADYLMYQTIISKNKEKQSSVKVIQHKYSKNNNVNFGSYMKDLQKQIKSNWNPPKADKSRRVVTLFKIGKQGDLKAVKIFKSSGLETADNAAITAIKKSAPFSPLPRAFDGKSIDVQFTFDYNVLKKI